MNLTVPNNSLEEFIRRAVEEDIGDGDHSSMACIPADAIGRARLLIKEKGILSGSRVAREIFSNVDPDMAFEQFIEDGTEVTPGNIAFHVHGKIHTILKCERLVLNIMQRMSGIATSTRQYTDRIRGYNAKLLDTRKTTPGVRFLEKEAVRHGGGLNHRMGLFDMIMLKDNHVDFAGGVENAILKTRQYLEKTGRKLKVVIEARNIEEVRKITETGHVNRIMLDNFSIDDTLEAVKLIAGRFEIESSGNITIDNIRDFAKCGVDFVSCGALTHHNKSLDMSLKAF